MNHDHDWQRTFDPVAPYRCTECGAVTTSKESRDSGSH